MPNHGSSTIAPIISSRSRTWQSATQGRHSLARAAARTVPPGWAHWRQRRSQEGVKHLRTHISRKWWMCVSAKIDHSVAPLCSIDCHNMQHQSVRSSLEMLQSVVFAKRLEWQLQYCMCHVLSPRSLPICDAQHLFMPAVADS